MTFTHAVPYDAPEGVHGLAQALCGVHAYPRDQSATPSCPRCAQILADDEASLARLAADYETDPRRI